MDADLAESAGDDSEKESSSRHEKNCEFCHIASIERGILFCVSFSWQQFSGRKHEQ